MTEDGPDRADDHFARRRPAPPSVDARASPVEPERARTIGPPSSSSVGGPLSSGAFAGGAPFGALGAGGAPFGALGSVSRPAPAPRRAPELAAPPARPPIGRAVAGGLAAIGVFFGGFGTWAATAPIASASIASGRIVAEGNRRSVQHKEGGIIAEILVRDGDEVEAGEVLMRMDDVRASADAAAIDGELASLLAVEARLLAQRDGADAVTFPEELASRADDRRIADAMAAQTRLFAASRRSLQGRLAILENRIELARNQRAGAVETARSLDRRIALVDRELDDVRSLLDRRLARRPRLLELQGRKADLEGRRSAERSRIDGFESTIAETETRILTEREEFVEQTTAQLEETQRRIAELRQKSLAAADVRARGDIVAPVAGTVVDLRYFTEGGVVNPGQAVLDLVPRDEDLIVEAQIDPNDIDVVFPGQKVEIRLKVYGARSTPTLDGVLETVSADLLHGADGAQSYYEGEVRIVGELEEGVELYPGMPVDVMVKTGENTMLAYLLGPLIDVFERAFRES